MSELGPTVSVIIPTYNSSGTLRLTLQTVLCQDFTDFEVWVVGDGCTDDSENAVASFADDRLHWMNLPSNSGGPSLPRNEGLRRAKGRFIAYLGHDDLWFPWHLSELVDCIETSNSDFVYSLGATLGPDGVIGTFSLPHRAWSRSEGISPSNWLHRKCLTEVVGSWSTDKIFFHDQEFLQRVLGANVRLEFRRQLSVLTFPSDIWHLYSINTDFPQGQYVKAMRQDAARFRDELLLELATLASSVSLYEQTSPLHRRLMIRAVHFYGLHRWPVSELLRRRWRRRAGLGEAKNQ
ncbi:glycosyltransferase family 2 protein [[Eubacterium] cellulosolvens]